MTNGGVGAVWRNETKLNPKDAWDAYVKYRSINKARRHLINPATDRPYAARTVEVRAYEYALQNQGVVRSDWEAEARRVGVVPDEGAWKTKLVAMAHCLYYYRPKMYDKFIAENNLQAYAR